jgi:hypothetical protein
LLQLPYLPSVNNSLRFRSLVLVAFVACFCGVAVWSKPTAATPKFHAPVQCLPLPNAEPQQALYYRHALNPVDNHNSVAFWLMGDAQPGAISLYIFASNGQAGAPLPVPGSGHDTEPLWPAWISKPISTNFAGWRRVLVPQSDLTYRAPVDGSAESAPSFQTADAIGIASTKRSGTIYIDDIVWANFDSSGNAVGDSSIIDDFSSGDLSAWKVKGPPEAAANLMPGITAQAQYVRDARVSLKLDYSNWIARRALLSSGVARALTATGNSYLVSIPASPFERILPESLPTANELSSRVTLIECPDQTEAGSFALYCQNDLTHVSVRLLTNLNAIGKFIPRSFVNIGVVKVWDREGNSVLIDPDSVGPTPELIVKNDAVPLVETGGQPPRLRVTGDPVTNIPANSEKQFWIDVTVPRNTPPGQYTGQMVVTCRELPPFTVTLETDVLPLRLLSPAKQYVVGYRGQLGDTPAAGCVSGDHVTPVQLSAELGDISLHGFHYVSLSDSPDSLADTMSAESQFNFQTPLIYPVTSGADGLAEAQAVSKMANGPSTYYYLVPVGPSMDQDVINLKKAGLQTAAVINSNSDYNDIQDDLDVAIYPVDYSYVQDLLRTGGRRENSTRDWLTWPAAQSNPQVDRLYSGYLLWRMNLYGEYVSDYQTSYTDNPFDDTVSPTVPGFAGTRPAMLTYPTANGVVDTVQWESIREGINDVRYLTTYYTALRECKDAKVDEDEIAQSQTDVTNFMNQDFWLMSDVAYQKGRAMITMYALDLREAVDSYNKKHTAVGK